MQKQAADAVGNVRTQAENVANNVQQQANAAIDQAVSPINELQQQANNVLSQAQGTLVANSIESLGSQASDTIDQITKLIGSRPQLDMGANIIKTLGNSSIILTIISSFTIGDQSVASSLRTLYTNDSSNNPALVLNTIAGGNNPFPAFSSRIIQPTSLDSLQRTKTTSSDCGNDGDLRSFVVCFAAKAAGLCSLDVFKSRQCRATCGNICKLQDFFK